MTAVRTGPARPAPPPPPSASRPTPFPARLFAGLRRHGLLAVLLVAGAGLRLAAWLAYQPAILYIDSFRYLRNLSGLDPTGLNPIGYELLVLSPLLAIGDLRLVTALQHLAGLGVAVAMYALLLRHGARRWVAAAATAPILLDAYQVQIEQNIMTEAFFAVLLIGTLWLLSGRGVPGPGRSAAAGVLLATMVFVRLVAGTLLVPALVYLVIAGGSRPDVLRRVGAALLGFAVVVATYGAYFWSQTGRVGLTNTAGSVLYGRTADLADCDRLPLTEAERQLCPTEPLDERLGVDFYTHEIGSPRRDAVPEPGGTVADLERSFTNTVLLHQPLDVAAAVLTDFLKGFAPTRTTGPTDVPVERWHFELEFPEWNPPDAVDEISLEYGGMLPQVDEDLAAFLRSYQLSVGWTPGPVLAGALLLGLIGMAGRGGSRRVRSACLLTAGAGITLLLTAAAFEFSWRYQLPALILLPLAGALGLTALLGRPPRPLLDPFPDDVDAAALADFRDRYGDAPLGPVMVLIAAYNEADGLPPVLDSVPASYRDLRIDTLVVVDGGTDGTSRVALSHPGVRTCVAPVNRGQGAALRLGYRIAHERGARFVVTTDADGQYDMVELPLLLDPLVDGDADFVTGSRRLGREQTTDRFRRVGVRVFAALAGRLTGQSLTDTSFGFRAMTVDVPESVTLRQPQYQASELLVGTILAGHRVVEAPMTMRDRAAGESKKGTNLVYGMRYGRVLVGTWWRDRAKTSRSNSTNLSTNMPP